MKSSVVKVAVAAAIIVAVVAGIILWTGTRSGMVLADVLSKMEQIQAFSYKATLHVTDSGSGVPAAGTDVEMTMLVTNEYGMRMDMSSTDPNGSRTTTQQMYWLPQQKMAITVLPEMKMYTRIELDDSMFEEMRKENNDPRVMVRQILDCQYEKLGRSVMDGVEVEGFRTTDPAYVGGGLKDGNVTIWVDVKRGLPVRMEMKMKGSEQMEMGVEGTLHDFQWDVPVSAAEFTPTIPADFRAGPGDGTRLPPMTEETAVAGLKLCQELTGKYPDDLNLTTLTRVMREKFEREQTFAAPPEPPQLPDLKTSLGKDSRLTMPPQRPGPAASREEMEKWLEEMKQWHENVEKTLAEEKKAMEEADRREDEWRKEMEKWRANQRKLPENSEELMRAIEGDVKKMMPVQMLGVFYMDLAEEKKDPAYYGKVVKPGDAALVLLRWKMAENQYRVIFGDLHALTVDADTLATLEAALPK